MNSFLQTIILFLFVIISCKNNIEKKTEASSSTNKKYEEDTIANQKIEPVKKVQEYNRLTQIAKKYKIGDTISIILTKEYSIPVKRELKQDSTFYYKGVYLNLFNKSLSFSKNDSLKTLIDNKKYDKRINLGIEGNPNNAKIRTWNFNAKTNYDWFLAIDMLVSSDFLETTLIGFNKKGGNLIAQEVSMDLNNVQLKDSILIFTQNFSEPLENGSHILIDSVRINIYSLKRESQTIKDSIETFK